MEPQGNVNNMNRVPSDEGSVGPVIATIIILAVIVLGGLYFWHERTDMDDTVPAVSNLDEVDAITAQSSSDETSSIEADLNSTNTNIDTEITAS